MLKHPCFVIPVDQITVGMRGDFMLYSLYIRQSFFCVSIVFPSW